MQLQIMSNITLQVTLKLFTTSMIWPVTTKVSYVLRACSYDPAYRDVSLTETNISVRSYGIFRPACRDEITL
jgi:hypothetical protein